MILRSTLWAGIPFRGWEGAKNHKETATEKWKREIGGFWESPHRLPSPQFLLEEACSKAITYQQRLLEHAWKVNLF